MITTLSYASQCLPQSGCYKSPWNEGMNTFKKHMLNFLEENSMQVRWNCGWYFYLACDSCRFKTVKCLKISLWGGLVFLIFPPLFLCQIYCVIMSCKIPQSVAKLSFKKEDEPKIEMSIYFDAFKEL